MTPALPDRIISAATKKDGGQIETVVVYSLWLHPLPSAVLLFRQLPSAIHFFLATQEHHESFGHIIIHSTKNPTLPSTILLLSSSNEANFWGSATQISSLSEHECKTISGRPPEITKKVFLDNKKPKKNLFC